MRSSIFRDNDKVLLLGEGNFSFAVSLVKLNHNIEVTATCYESSIAFESGIGNAEYLKNRGVRVFLGIDATKLSEHSILGLKEFDKIIFNFPHVGGKMKIDRNRDLIKRFFISAENMLKSDGIILVTLCNGQGGTPADIPQRRWDDSWQIVEMAAHGNFLLTQIEPFFIEILSDYSCVGYRSLEKGFCTENSLVHVFRKSEKPDSLNIAFVDSDFDLDSMNFSDLEGVSDRREFISKIVEKDLPRESEINSIYPLSYAFDITFSVGVDFREIQFYALLYYSAGKVIDDLKFLGEYKFPHSDKVTRTYRIFYKSSKLPLYRNRVIDIHKNMVTKILEDRLKLVVTK